MTDGRKRSVISLINMQILLCFTLGNYLIQNVCGLPVSNITVANSGVSTESNEKVVLTSISSVVSSINCTFMTESDNLPTEIDLQMKEDTKVLFFKIHFPGWSGNILGFEQGNLYSPSHWVLARGRLGKGLLLLKHNYEILSLSTLSLNTQKMDISLIQSTPNCIEKMNVSTFEIAVRELLLDNFKKNEAGDAICNINIAEDNGVANFFYKCCRRNSDGNIKCEDVTRDIWLTMLFTIIFLLKLYVILASPRLVPETFYRLKYVTSTYMHRLGNKPINLKVLLTRTPEKYPDVRITTDASRFKYMPKFKEKLHGLKPDVVYNLKIPEIHMKVEGQRLIPEDDAPVGFLKSLYDSFVRCKIRERPSVSRCCYSDMCMRHQSSKRIPWHKFLSKLMMCILMLLLTTPWILRVYLYYKYEHEEMNAQRDVATRRGLSLLFPGSVTLYLTPSHVLFIVIYVLLSIEYILYGVVKEKIRQRFMLVIQKCFRDMRERNISEIFGWSASMLLKPCTSLGVVGVCLGMIFWIIALPYLLMVLSFYLFPTVNLTLRMFGHFIVFTLPRGTKLTNNHFCSKLYQCLNIIRDKTGMHHIAWTETLEINEQELKMTKNRCLQLLVITICLISMYSVIFLLTEIVSFYVEMAVYTSIGIILNAKTTLTYLSLTFLMVMYANSCFNYVVDRYQSVNKTVNKILQELPKENVDEVIYFPGDQQRNLAFSVKTDDLKALEDPVSLVKTEVGFLRWRASRLVLFLSTNDMPFVPRKFFFDACKMPHYSCPGELLFNYLRAFGEFSTIVAFLLFVLVIVLAFGETYQLSATNQMLATLAGGFLPWIFRNVVFRTHVPPSLDKSNPNFKICFSELLGKYKQDWPIDDIVVEELNEIHKYGDDVISGTGMTLNIPSSSGIDENDRHSVRSETSSQISLTENTGVIVPAELNRIDLLIDADFQEYPELQPAAPFNISTSLLDDKEMEEVRSTA
ncbi:hypothetical protein CHS0354_017703 [Potamilus streckersoni]|uniref:Uncharacterized protein n=1 Tax=Potamilus streckersoni TaxID=2493646 RepID=A0AAE0S3S3_9BIVA|nr:hypothetical protein CHS0354_017703 [Potamilus streckersoni]